MNKGELAAAYAALCENDARNRLILHDVMDAVKAGRHPIVLTQRTAHVGILAETLSAVCENVITLTGGASNKQRREVMTRLNALPESAPFIIVATGKYVGEGFDYPRLDTLFLAMPISWKGTLQQYAGRLHREYSGKREVIIYDYVDVHIRMLEHMYHKRVQGYASIGYKAKCEGEVQDSVGILFDNKNFLPAFSQDIGQTKGQIVIVSPYMRKARVKGIARLFSAAELNGAQITIVTRPARSYRPADQPIISELLDSLKELGCTVAEREGIHQKFAVIDHRIIWYGSLNILSFGGSEESMMRLESREIACELESILT